MRRERALTVPQLVAVVMARTNVEGEGRGEVCRVVGVHGCGGAAVGDPADASGSILWRVLFDQGKLAMSGPWVDDTGAMLIYEAADMEEAQGSLDADPYWAGRGDRGGADQGVAGGVGAVCGERGGARGCRSPCAWGRTLSACGPRASKHRPIGIKLSLPGSDRARVGRRWDVSGAWRCGSRCRGRRRWRQALR